MKSIAALLAGIMLFGLGACSENPVGTDEESSSGELKKKPPPVPQDPSEWPITVTFADRAGDQIRSDAELRSDLTDYSYVDGECGVWANIGNFDDARFDPDGSYKTKLARTCGAARVLVFEFDDGRPDRQFGAFVNINRLCSMAVGDVRGDSAQFNVCNTLLFEEVRQERISQTTWTVSTDGASGATAVCSGDGSTHTMPFQLTITAQVEDPSTLCPVGP